MKIEILIRKIRTQKHYTIEKLSILSGISKSNISKIERQEVDPTLSTLLSISVALKTDIKELYKTID